MASCESSLLQNLSNYLLMILITANRKCGIMTNPEKWCICSMSKTISKQSPGLLNLLDQKIARILGGLDERQVSAICWLEEKYLATPPGTLHTSLVRKNV